MTCGSVDDGKSTLIGRMLYEAQVVFDDQLADVQSSSHRDDTGGGEIDFALLVDGLSAEREQGITIDVAYRYFATERRRFIVADTPGHEQYTRNMVTGASTAEVAVVLVDARKGIVEQTRRHSFIASLLGVRHVVLAVNKMDLVGFDRRTYEDIVADYLRLTEALTFQSVTPIPLSAKHGDNVLNRSARADWYDGPTLLGFLDTVETGNGLDDHGFRMPVQWVNRLSPGFRGYAGTVAAGSVAPGDKLRVLPSGETATVDTILIGRSALSSARTGQSVTLTFDGDLDISRGDVLVCQKTVCAAADQLQANLVWMARDSGFVGRSYRLKLGTTTANATLSEIRHKYNMETFEEIPGRALELNDISVVKLSLDRPIAFESFRDCAPMGAFVLIDRQDNQTVAAGMIDFALRRADNVQHQPVTVNKKARARLNGHPGRVLWFTGLSGSGKSTIANALELRLHQQGFRTYILDGDNIRLGLNRDLGFTDAHRVENIRRISEVAKLMVDAGLIVMTAFISPFRAERRRAREMFEKDEFVEVFVDTPLLVAERRDPKGLYRKARNGELPNFTGIDSPYETPQDPEFVLKAAERSPDQLVDELLAKLDLRIDR